AVDGFVDEFGGETRHPSWQTARDESVESSFVRRQPRSNGIHGKVDRAVVGFARNDRAEPAAGGGCPLWLDQVLAGKIAEQVLHITVAESAQHGGCHNRTLGDQLLRVVR